MQKKMNKPHQHGHRQRLKEKFLKAEGLGLADYELLELVLFYAIPRIDVKPLAKDLLAHFGSFERIFSASTEELKKFPRIGENAATLFKLIHLISCKFGEEQILKKPIFSSWQQVVDYYRTVLAHEKQEQFRLLFLDGKNKLIKDELQSKGTINEAPIYPREVIRRCLEVGAAGIVMVHNHPSGDPQPSQSDIDITMKINKAAKAVGIVLHDHIIIGLERHESFKSLGLL